MMRQYNDWHKFSLLVSFIRAVLTMKCLSKPERRLGIANLHIFRPLKMLQICYLIKGRFHRVEHGGRTNGRGFSRNVLWIWHPKDALKGRNRKGRMTTLLAPLAEEICFT